MGMSYGPCFQIFLPQIFNYPKSPINGRLWDFNFKKILTGINNMKKEQISS